MGHPVPVITQHSMTILCLYNTVMVGKSMKWHDLWHRGLHTVSSQSVIMHKLTWLWLVH